MERLISFFGLFVMIGLAWLMSSQRRKISVRVIAGGLLLQFVFALLVFKTAPGRTLFVFLGDVFNRLLDFVDEGSQFVFGPNFKDVFFAFKVLPTIIFFSAFMGLLYHFGVMQRLIHLVAVVMQWTLKTSGAESLSAAANIFVGQTEAPLVIRPYVERMTLSELMATMVGGFATVAGGVLAIYVGWGIDAAHLMTASVISAPAALLIAKVLQPEVEEPATLGGVHVRIERTSVNAVDAVARGAADGVKLAINVAAMLIAFVALIALFNALVGWFGGLFGQTWSLEAGLGYIFAPLAWLMGIETADCLRAGQLLGLKMVATELVAYQRLSEWIGAAGGADAAADVVRLSDRTVLILTYALCGFANFGSIGIQLGGIGPLAPSRKGDLARLGLRAMLGGTLAAFMTACVAGILL